MPMGIQVLDWYRHNKVVDLNRLMRTQPSSLKPTINKSLLGLMRTQPPSLKPTINKSLLRLMRTQLPSLKPTINKRLLRLMRTQPLLLNQQ
jgi:hypothetical protein